MVLELNFYPFVHFMEEADQIISLRIHGGVGEENFLCFMSQFINYLLLVSYLYLSETLKAQHQQSLKLSFQLQCI